MFDKSYTFTKKGTKHDLILSSADCTSIAYNRHIYTFESVNNQTYIVEIDAFEYDLFHIKFYPKAHKLSKNRYTQITNFGQNDFSKIIRTCIDIMISLYRKNEEASFFFIGASSEKESMNLENTQRFRIYKRVMQNFFSPLKFIHVEDKQQSFYLIQNKIPNANMLVKAIEAIRCHLSVDAEETD